MGSPFSEALGAEKFQSSAQNAGQQVALTSRKSTRALLQTKGDAKAWPYSTVCVVNV
jgi:hypothetical protein